MDRSSSTYRVSRHAYQVPGCREVSYEWCLTQSAPDRLYLASYTHTPNEQTPFPYPAKAAKSTHKRSASRVQGAAKPEPAQNVTPVYFSIEKSLLYNAFHADFGPLHIGHLYRFAVMLHDILGGQEHDPRPVVFWSNADSRSKCNMAA